MAAVVQTAILSPFGNPVERTVALLALYAGTDDEKKNLQGIRTLMYVDPSVAKFYSPIALDARIAAI